MIPEKAIQKLQALYQGEIDTICEHLCDDSFDLVASVIEAAEHLRCFGFLLQVFEEETMQKDEPDILSHPSNPEQLDSLGVESLTIEDFLRAVNQENVPVAVKALAQILGIPPQSAAACLQNFVHKWRTDATTYDKIKQFVATQNRNQYQWLLYELFGITDISNRA